MNYIILAIVAGVSFFPLITGKLHLWLSHGLWVQTGVMIAFSYSFFEKPIRSVQNKPIGLLHFWVGLYTAFICLQTQYLNKYDIKHFFPYFNFLCLLMFYKFVTEYLTRKDIERVLKWMRYVVIITLFLCVLQKFHLAQYFEMLYVDTPKMWNNHNNPVVGFIGNGTHLSGFLASTVPLFLWKSKREDWLVLMLMFLVLFYTGTSLGDPAISGFIIFVALLLYFYKNKKKITFVILGILSLGGMIIYPNLPDNFLGMNGRIGYWKYYFGIFKQMPVSGIGLGSMSVIFKNTSFPELQKLHMEFLHYLLEIGIIGLVLILNVVKRFFEVKTEDRLELVLKSMVVGFLISCCFNYPSHLWLPSVFAIFAYASLMTLKEDRNVCLIS